ncbi:PREDICTED: uncharacterized protein LOC100638128 isoform X2 [Amphimedon queenslandica]|uniref:Protein kinase domain-containing protein n=1 Tax=Amphimedon queenslandica TaxID=400682 RepID=A0AAN0J109_AMPQE|nr:PREDICTED: uncharacterized protein LOC100638128 isoform X2 [Amphimedon queenslandica]|eukprot:XP_019850411.1 PREDICTED: uncharacterized protein LOC100638128 isoform X2 [Amphimedon queenslandica]
MKLFIPMLSLYLAFTSELPVYGAQQCTERFMQYSLLSQRSRILPLEKTGVPLDNSVTVLREYEFNCTTTISKLVLGINVRIRRQGRNTNRVQFPSVMIYRDTGNQYTPVANSERKIYFSTSNVSTSEVFEYLLEPSLRVFPGDLLAISQPGEEDSIVRVYSITGETGVAFSSQVFPYNSQTIELTSTTQISNQLILVYPVTDEHCVQSSNSISESVIRSNALQIHGTRLPADKRQYLYPEMIFSCNGTLTKWIYGGIASRESSDDDDMPELQIWRKTGPNTYIKTKSSQLINNVLNITNVYEFTPQSPLEFQEGDVFGMYIPESTDFQLYEQEESGPNNLRVDSGDPPSTITPTRSEGANDFPLVTAEVSIQATESSKTLPYTTTGTTTTNEGIAFTITNTGLLSSTSSDQTMTTASSTSAPGNISNPRASTATVPAVITTVILVIIIIGIIAGILIALYFVRRKNKKESNVYALPVVQAKQDRLQTLANPLYSDNQKMPNEKDIYTLPNYDRESSFYAEAGMPAPKVYHQPNMGEYMEPTQTLPSEWGIVVPTMSQRCKLISHTGSLELQNVLYNKDNASTNGVFFSESDIYWTPGADCSSIYDQLYKYKFRELRRDQIKIGDHLGSGQFGSVCKGVWQSPTGPLEVATKTLTGNTSDDDRVKFLQEAAIMGQFHHPNVVKLYGMVTIEEPMMIVLEFMNNGDMKNYLHTLQPQPGELVPTTVPSLLLSFCRQIASGMEYLSKKSFVHRDLAARNILVAEGDRCKISDFGLSRDLQDENYYISKGGQVPIKWTAPEAIHYKKYSSASDVWSYGVLLYEIWSLGHRPFHNMTNQEAFRKVESGYRLPPPPGCSRQVYEIMIQCWHPETSQRPSFIDLVTRLSQSDYSLIKWSQDDKSANPQSVVLVGANIEAGQYLFTDLQCMYSC